MDCAPGPHDEPFEPRPHDHLVEPVFGGLGIDPPSRRTVESERAREPARTRRFGGCLAPTLLLAAVLLLAP